MISNNTWTPIGEAANQVTENLRAQAELMRMDRRDPEERQYVEGVLEKLVFAFDKAMDKKFGPILTLKEIKARNAARKRTRYKSTRGK